MKWGDYKNHYRFSSGRWGTIRAWFHRNTRGRLGIPWEQVSHANAMKKLAQDHPNTTEINIDDFIHILHSAQLNGLQQQATKERRRTFITGLLNQFEPNAFANEGLLFQLSGFWRYLGHEDEALQTAVANTIKAADETPLNTACTRLIASASSNNNPKSLLTTLWDKLIEATRQTFTHKYAPRNTIAGAVSHYASSQKEATPLPGSKVSVEQVQAWAIANPKDALAKLSELKQQYRLNGIFNVETLSQLVQEDCTDSKALMTAVLNDIQYPHQVIYSLLSRTDSEQLPKALSTISTLDLRKQFTEETLFDLLLSKAKPANEPLDRPWVTLFRALFNTPLKDDPTVKLCAKFYLKHDAGVAISEEDLQTLATDPAPIQALENSANIATDLKLFLKDKVVKALKEQVQTITGQFGSPCYKEVLKLRDLINQFIDKDFASERVDNAHELKKVSEALAQVQKLKVYAHQTPAKEQWITLGKRATELLPLLPPLVRLFSKDATVKADQKASTEARRHAEHIRSQNLAKRAAVDNFRSTLAEPLTDHTISREWLRDHCVTADGSFDQDLYSATEAAVKRCTLASFTY